MTVFYFWLRNTKTKERLENPYPTTIFMGDVGDLVTAYGEEFVIEDWTKEEFDVNEPY